MGAVTASVNVPYNDVLKSSWTNIPSNFVNDQFILGRQAPFAPTIACMDVCAKSIGNIFTASGGSGNTFSWTVTGGTITSGQGSNSISVNWGTTGGTITVIQVNSSGCASTQASCTVNVYPSPSAGFDTTSMNSFHTVWTFFDKSTGSTNWYWDFGDGQTSTNQNPNHQYGSAGTYTVRQVVKNQYGCLDTLVYTINVLEGIIIPNVFTPNGDGTNDQFYIPNSGVKEFYIEIFNRWGLKLFETTASEIRWDGRTAAGVRVSDGTYYYILKAVMPSGKDYSTHGFLEVLSQSVK
jgi:gliding motility-associated-like protein